MPTDKDPVELERCDPEAEKLFRSIKNGTVHEVISKINEKPSLLQLQDASGRAALHFAAYFGRIDVIETLFKNEHSRLIDVDLEDFDGNTPLVLAVKQRDAKVTGYLIKVAQSNVSKQLKRNVTVLHHAACVSNNVEVLKIIMQSERLEKSVLTETVDGGTPLHWACHCNDIVNISYFLDDLDVNVDVRDEHGGSPLFVATFLKSTEVVRFLLERGANVLCSAKDGSTPLSLAIDEVKDIEVVRLLLSFAPIQKVKSLNLKSSDKMIQKEIESERMGPTERKEMCERFKKQGNNVFSEGQYMKAIRFYTLSISHDPTNHTLFSNRSACHFNLGQFRQALADARQCVRLTPGWVKGYYRLSAALYELGEFETCSEFCKKGLLLDSSYQDLKQVYERCQTKINSARASSNQV